MSRRNPLWQELIDGDVSERDIEERWVAGISLEEQVRNLREEQKEDDAS